MKKIFTFLATVLLTATVWAQSPEKMNYQAVIRNSSDALVTNTLIGMQISILQGSASGTAVYVETQTPSTNANGLVSIEIGAGTVQSGDFTTIDWANDTYFIKTETDPVGGTSYSITGTSQLLSVPYALHAKTADSIVGGVLFSEVDGSVTNEIQNLSSVLTQDNSAGNANITNLADPVNAQDAATKAYVDLLEAQIDALEAQMVLSQGFTDIDGNHYDAVLIGKQIWMAENLKVTHYPNGDTIPLVTDNTDWGNLSDDNTSDAYSYYNNDAGGEAATYGALYTYAAAKDACPTGWHLPTDTEWTELETYISNDGHSGTEGTALKTTSGWNSSGNGTDDYGFSALPGGDRNYFIGSFLYVGNGGYWWGATESGSDNAYYRYLSYDNSGVDRFNYHKSYGFSVRCVRD